jgi:hypothetical protein
VRTTDQNFCDPLVIEEPRLVRRVRYSVLIEHLSAADKARIWMKHALNTAIIGLALIAATNNAWAQSGAGTALGAPHRRGPRVTAALMLSGGESPNCRRGNINDAYVVTVSPTDKRGIPRYISSSGEGCVVLPIRTAVGTQLSITGVLQDTTAIPGGEVISRTSSISENCFNVEGYSVGLSANSASEFDPADPANIINAQGYGFFWYDSDSDLKPGPYKYTVVGCSGHDCPTATTYYNSDGLPGTAPPCAVLSPLRTTAQEEPVGIK